MFGLANLKLYLHVLGLVLHYNLANSTSVFLVELSLCDSCFFDFFRVLFALLHVSYVHYLHEFHLEAFLCMTGVLHLTVSRCWAEFRIWWVFHVTYHAMHKVAFMCDVNSDASDSSFFVIVSAGTPTVTSSGFLRRSRSGSALLIGSWSRGCSSTSGTI